MEQDALVALADVQRLRDLLRLPAGEVTQQDHLLLARRQLRDRLADLLERLLAEQALFGPPGGRRVRPRAVGREALGIDRGLEAGERHAAPLTCPARARAVGHDAQNPRLEARAALEAVK